MSQIGPITDEQRKNLIANSLVAGVYEKTVDRESAYEVLKGRTATRQGETTKTVGGSASSGNAPAAIPNDATRPDTNPNLAGQPEPGFFDKIGGMFGGTAAGGAGGTAGAGRRREGLGEAMAKSAARAIGSQVGREILRGVLGSILGSKRR